MSSITEAQPAHEPTPDPRVFEWIPARLLVIDQRVQREVIAEKIARIVNEFDWARVEAITVIRYADGRVIVVEGQHRSLAIQQLNTELLVPCMVLPPDYDDQQQAQIALNITTGRSPHNAYEKWQQRLAAGHPHELMADKVLREHGIRLGKSPSTATISAAATVTRIVHSGSASPELGSELLDNTLIVLMSAFPIYDHESNVNRWDSNVMLTVANLLRRNEDVPIDHVQLARALKTKPAMQWINIGRTADDQPRWERIAKVVTDEYNRGKRKGRIQ